MGCSLILLINVRNQNAQSLSFEILKDFQNPFFLFDFSFSIFVETKIKTSQHSMGLHVNVSRVG